MIEKKTPFDIKSPPKKRQAKSKKDGGVKKLVIIGIAQEILETYDNVKAILKLLKLEKIDFFIATDYKLCNILFGLSSHSGAFGCPFCKVRYNEFHDPKRCVSDNQLGDPSISTVRFSRGYPLGRALQMGKGGQQTHVAMVHAVFPRSNPLSTCGFPKDIPLAGPYRREEGCSCHYRAAVLCKDAMA